MVQRLIYRKRHSYTTKYNQHRVVQTPAWFSGGISNNGQCYVGDEDFLRLFVTAGVKLVYQTTKKRAGVPKCPVTGKRTQGIPHLIPAKYRRSRLPWNRRTVNHAYGCVLSGRAVREGIIQAFLVEVLEIVKKVLKIQKAKEKLASKC